MTENDVKTEPEIELRRNFVSAMRRLIATVTIITAGDASARAGMVATAVMSVSADPPSLVVGINREATVWQAVKDTGRFSVNLLATHHAPLVYPFSGQLQGEERFTLGEWHAHTSRRRTSRTRSSACFAGWIARWTTARTRCLLERSTTSV